MRPTLFYILPSIITGLICTVTNAAEPRFVALDHARQPAATTTLPQNEVWPCVFDRNTGLTWEVKSRQPGLHYHLNTYSWFDPKPARNGGLAGEPGGKTCRTTPSDPSHDQHARDTACDTRRFVQAVNRETLCSAQDWRLPRREELRSLVDYRIPYPGPTINTRAFPNTVAQFYWSADTAAAEASEAWGIGFAFGFDYAYYKSNRVHVRLVRGTLSTTAQQP